MRAEPAGAATAFAGALAGEAVVLYCYFNTKIAFLWYNVIGALVVVAVALAVNPLIKERGKG